MRTFQDAEERLAATLANYESRPQQQAFAAAVESALASKRHLVAEAGCGTGKSFGYLIPAILSGKRVIVSTATKALQDQVALGDLPFLDEHLGVDFTYAVLKGRSNYLCLNKAVDADATQVTSLGRILTRAQEEGFNGEREDLGFEVSNGDWMAVAADTDDCQAYNCKENDLNCFAQIAKKRAQEARIVVVNHALFFTDLVVREMTGGFASLLDEYDAVVFDEAHEAEEYASNVLGSRFSQAGIIALASEVRNWAHRVDDDKANAASETGSEMVFAADQLWKKLEIGRVRAATLTECEEEWVALALKIQDLHKAVSAVDLERVSTADVAKLRKQKARLQRRTISMAQRFVDIIAADFADLVRWVEEETTKKGEKIRVIKSSPVNVGKILREMLFANDESPVTAVLVSATMLVDGKADYIAGRLGLDDFDSLDVGTPFDFQKQARLYVPEHLPAPDQKNKEAWNTMSIVEIGNLVRASNGRALVLFSSTKQMRDAYGLLAETLDYTCMMQGQRPNKELAKEFMADKHSVLFATKSFFTGVDFQGEACSLVIVDKLPFPVPTEPVTEARCEAIRAAGGNDFGDYVIPIMALTLKQGFGRLIRHRNDTGVVAILDSRLLSKGYGKQILRSLPDAKRVTRIDEVHEAYADFAST